MNDCRFGNYIFEKRRAADAAVLILSLPICVILDRPARKLFPEETAGQERR